MHKFVARAVRQVTQIRQLNLSKLTKCKSADFITEVYPRDSFGDKMPPPLMLSIKNCEKKKISCKIGCIFDNKDAEFIIFRNIETK